MSPVPLIQPYQSTALHFNQQRPPRTFIIYSPAKQLLYSAAEVPADSQRKFEPRQLLVVDDLFRVALADAEDGRELSNGYVVNIAQLSKQRAWEVFIYHPLLLNRCLKTSAHFFGGAGSVLMNLP